jgi:hypothetical protein
MGTELDESQSSDMGTQYAAIVKTSALKNSMQAKDKMVHLYMTDLQVTMISLMDRRSCDALCLGEFLAGLVWHSSSSSSTPPRAQPNSFSSTKTGSGAGWNSLTTPLQTQLLELNLGVGVVPNRPMTSPGISSC